MLRAIRSSSLRAGLVGAALLALGAWPASGQEQEHLGSNRDWHAFRFMEDGQPVCYVVSAPVEEAGDYTRRGEVFTLVTHRPAEQSRGVVSMIAGYTFEPGSEVSVVIGDETFELFTDQDNAWTRDPASDMQLVEAMKAGARMVVRGTSSRGTLTTDTYSLFGFTASYELISEACGLSA